MSTDRNSSEKKPVEASSGVTGHLPPPIALYQLATGQYISRSLFLVARLGIADLLSDGPRHCNDLAKSTETHPPSLRRVMRLLASVGVFCEEENGEFSLTPMGEYLRTRMSPGRSAPWRWCSLENVCRNTGKIWNFAFGPDNLRFGFTVSQTYSKTRSAPPRKKPTSMPRWRT
jgi:hypothetical protein